MAAVALPEASGTWDAYVELAQERKAREREFAVRLDAAIGATAIQRVGVKFRNGNLELTAWPAELKGASAAVLAMAAQASLRLA